MGLYLIAAITLNACSKDSATEAAPQEDVLTAKFGLERAPDYSFDYYGATKSVKTNIESKGFASFPLTESDLAYYQEVAGHSIDIELAKANFIAEQVVLSQEMGFKNYMNEKLDLKEYTKATVLDIMENGSRKRLTGEAGFGLIPAEEQNMLMAANSAAQSYESTGRSYAGTRDFIAGVAYGIAGAATGAYFGGLCCGPVGAIVGGIIGGVLGWLGGSAKD